MTAPGWDPAQYLRYEDLRLRPALDLLRRVDVADPTEVHDLGCGVGQLARIMQDRWPRAHVVGSDSSAEMLDQARTSDSRVEWIELDARDWDSAPTHDVIYSNALLHWIPDHDGLMVRLLDSLRPGGTLAVQMPLSWYEPSHVLMRQTLAGENVGSAELRAAYAKPNVAPPDHYAALLAAHATSIDLWTTRYFQVLRGPNPVLEWVSGTALRPMLEALSPDDLSRFLRSYSAALRDACPQRQDGSTFFPFPRLFFVVTK